jgi:DNA polymerase-3 subunit epsilon
MLLDGEMACVDLETTGGNALHHRIIEVGIVLLRGGEVVEEWSSLVNPGCRIPRGIEEFTGISTQMVEAAPPFGDLAREVLERLSGRLFVAHNARFDYGFLRTEFRRLDVRFRAPVLCTVKLSRRIDPGVRGHSLDAVMERHGLSCAARHRALGDARVVADLLGLLRKRHDPQELEGIVADLTREVALPPQLEPDLAEDLPEAPGVYRFWGEDDALLYVGKSTRLRTRVLSHFAGDHRATKELRLSRQVRRVDWVETAGELGALLKEARWVKELGPLHNRRLRGTREAWTIQLLDSADGGVRAEVLPIADIPIFLSDENAFPSEACEKKENRNVPACYGVFRARKDARKALDELIRAHELCRRALGLEEGQGSCFGYQVGRCRGACAGKESPALHATRARLALARHKLRDWPFRGPVGVRERDWRGVEEIHVFDRWRYRGTADATTPVDELLAGPLPPFDLDSYRILCRFLDRPAARATLLELG